MVSKPLIMPVMQPKNINAQQQFLELLNGYPSPHNGQPITLRPVDAEHYQVHFQRERGLQATDVSFIFSFVSMGVFIAYAQACGRALGHKVSYRLTLPLESDLRGEGAVAFADLTIKWNVNPPDGALHNAITFRQTSRKKYDTGITPAAAQHITELALEAGMQLHQLSVEQAHQAIWLNQRAVFDDMFDEPVNKELDHWLRYSKREKESKQDGLAYDCMQLNGTVMKYIVHHPSILHAPVIAPLIQKYYLRTMADKSDVFYMLAPFKTESDSFAVGTVIANIWLSLSQQNYYLHPFGTIMSNHAAHADFLKLVGVSNETREHNYLVFIFRAGHSEPPAKSLRLPYNKHLLME